MVVYLYDSFKKAPNSFKVPSGFESGHVTKNGEIKGDFSPIAPVIRFDTIPVTAVPAYSYAQIPAFNDRYYFVSWAFVSGAWEGSFKCDVLASFKTRILSTTQYVARSASRMNRTLIDSKYVTTSAISSDIQSKTFSDIFGIANDLAGVYVVGIVGYTATSTTAGNQPSNIGAVTYYAMARAAFYGFMYALLSNVNWLNIDVSEISQDLQKALINPTQYIVSCIWLPVSASNFILDPGNTFPSDIQADKTTTIRCGWWDFNLGSGDIATVRKLRRPMSEYTYRAPSYTFTINSHPQKTSRGDWLNFSPYTRRVLEIPGFGNFELDTTKIKPSDTQLTVQYFINALCGDAICYVWSGTSAVPRSTLVLSVAGQIGVPIPIGQVSLNLSNFKNGLIAGAAAGASELADIVKGG